MNDNKTLKDIIIEVTEQDIDANCPELSASPEEMMAKIANKERTRKKKCLGYIAVAAVLIVAFVVVGVKFGDTILHVDADKNGKEEILTDDGVIVEDNGWGRSSEDWLAITDWADIPIVKTHVEKILIPEYLPDGYVFESFNAYTTDGIADCTYIFLNENDVLEIYEIIANENVSSLKIEDANEKIESKRGEIFMKNSGENKIATIYIDDGIVIEIHSKLSNDEIVNIINNMN